MLANGLPSSTSNGTGADDDCEMDTVDSPSIVLNGDGLHNQHQHHPLHRHGDGHHHGSEAMRPRHLMNGSGDSSDILLNHGVGQNHVAVAGKKRPREDLDDEETKRIRTGG